MAIGVAVTGFEALSRTSKKLECQPPSSDRQTWATETRLGGKNGGRLLIGSCWCVLHGTFAQILLRTSYSWVVLRTWYSRVLYSVQLLVQGIITPYWTFLPPDIHST
jgi:hypothetical protein